MKVTKDKIIAAKDISKEYEGFKLGELSFDVPRNAIVGIIGENGAGKSTLLKMILGLTKVENGEINIFDTTSANLRNNEYRDLFNNISSILDENYFPEDLSADQINLIMDNIYTSWDKDVYENYLNQFNIQSIKTINNYSKGMKMKLALAVSLSHGSKLFILDEPTTGLDPVVRKEILDIFLELKNDNDATILFSTHIISDIEKVADYIMFIHKGKIVFYLHRKNIIDNYNLISGEKELMEEYIPNCFAQQVVGNELKILLDKKYKINNESLSVNSASLEEILEFYI